MKIMASGPITSWQIDGETVSDFIFGGFKTTEDGDCSHEIKRRLFLGRKISYYYSSGVINILPSREHMHFKNPAAAAAKSLQSCPTLCDPRDGSPPGSPIPGILQARTLEWVAISFSNA